MPEINSKKNKQPKKGSRKKSSKSPSKKKKGAYDASGIKWGGTDDKTEQSKITKQQYYLGIGALILLFLFVLFVFVDDSPESRGENQNVDPENMKNESDSASVTARDRTFNFANLMNSTTFSQSLKELQTSEDYNRLMVVVFDDSSKEENEGNPLKLRLFKKFDGIAKSLPRKKVFKRYDEEDLPYFILFDCGSATDPSSAQVCKQIVGDNIPNVLIFAGQQQPRALPTEHKSANQVIDYLYNLMQPAVKYLEELADAEDFVADDSQLHGVLFEDIINKQSNMDVLRVFDEVADLLRDYGQFGRTKNPNVIESFDLDIQSDLPSLLLWRTFGENPQYFHGNLTNKQTVHDFIMNNYVPIFGEFNGKTSNKYMKRGLPILWIAHNGRNNQENQLLLNTAKSVATRYKGQLSFVQLDVAMQPQIAQNFGLSMGDDIEDNDEDDDDDDNEVNEDLPQCFIMNQIAQIKENVDMSDIEGSIQKVINQYLRQLRIQRGETMEELIDDDDDDDEFEEDDDDDDDDDDDEDDVELGEDTETQSDTGTDSDNKPKQEI